MSIGGFTESSSPSAGGPSGSSQAFSVLVDGHAHLHGAHDPEIFVRAAADNFARAAARIGVMCPVAGILCLADPPGSDAFRRLRKSMLRPGLGARWRIRSAAEPESMILTAEDRPPLIVIAGRQINTAEGLELLALGFAEDIPGGLSAAESIDAARRAGALAVFPWGLGKWSLRRGRVLRRLFQDNAGPWFLGDTPHRPRSLPEPRAFRIARERGIPILAGTDPLFSRAGARRAGTYGFLAPGPIDLDAPARALRAGLAEANTDRAQPLTYGEPDGILRVGHSQIRLQIRKRLRKPVAHGTAMNHPR